MEKYERSCEKGRLKKITLEDGNIVYVCEIREYKTDSNKLLENLHYHHHIVNGTRALAFVYNKRTFNIDKCSNHPFGIFDIIPTEENISFMSVIDRTIRGYEGKMVAPLKNDSREGARRMQDLYRHRKTILEEVKRDFSRLTDRSMIKFIIPGGISREARINGTIFPESSSPSYCVFIPLGARIPAYFNEIRMVI
jgi:hypothetical protein